MRTHTQIVAAVIRYRWAMLAAAAILATVTAFALSAALAFGTHTVQGTATANPEMVVSAQQEKAAADAKAAAKAQADAAAAITALDELERGSIQATYDDPASNTPGITVYSVNLVRTAPGSNQYEGWATMSYDGGRHHDIAIHVVDDGVNTMWTIAAGALLPLFQS